MKLISMADFVLALGETSTFDTDRLDWYNMEIDILYKIRSYAEFLKQPLTLGMFVPCDLAGNVLEAPNGGMRDQDDRHHKLYSEAKYRVLFEGFGVCTRSEGLDCIVRNDIHTSISWIEGKMVEDLVKYDMELTGIAVKISGVA